MLEIVIILLVNVF